MRIVLPGALPDPREARELVPYLQKTAPTLFGWLEHARARILDADPAGTGCTPFEFWQLRARGFEPEDGQNFATGLGPLRAQALQNASIAPADAVWLVELVHVSPARDGAALLPAQELSITPEQSVALFESVRAGFAEAGFTLREAGGDFWRVEPPAAFAPRCASPLLVSLTSVNDWWPQDMEARPWRKLVNETQMLWFDHPVNRQRYQQGLLPVNSLWLYGGGRGEQLRNAPAGDDVQVHGSLLAFAVAQDWGGWLAALSELETRVFRPLAGRPMPGLVLTGRTRLAELEAPGWNKWKQWLPGSREAWRKWWSPPD
ncbi:hypothetical protein [Parapusillimonas granuli]|uniref:Phosphoglycerate mutase n=1 Tax=Parapusillimonas granuli TaxID=380911 RepID=A0A853G6P8_9BURK|nr:hypothetical protein [Parapusillimonas granuli]MBB5216938.1 hypothetical protein [Parapusillimonas granuli]MEB2400730.1 hypothetical protein [Alcaligenaceae bacterium]NYT50296.1 hypothetical protein [Parapusillimonas granuli]